MQRMTRIASEGQIKPIPIPETAHLTPEQRAEYTFIYRVDDDEYLIPESEARKITPFAEHMSVGDVWAPINQL